MLEKGTVSKAADLLRSEEGKDDGFPGLRPGRQKMGESEDSGCSGGVVVGSVVDRVAVDCGPDAEVVEMCRQQHDLFGRLRSAQNRHCVPRFLAWSVFRLWEPLLGPSREGIRQSCLLDEGA